MSLLRRRMMMQTMESGAKYPLVNGRHEFDNGGYVEVTNGNHVRIENVAQASYVNLSNINQNNENSSGDNNINYLPVWITLPAQSTCIFKILNIVRNGTATVIGVNFRKANAAQSLGFSNGNFTDSNDKIKYVTVNEDTDVGCLFIWIGNYTPYIEFDVELTVNGERWI